MVALRRMFEHYGVPHDDALLRRFVGRRGPEVFAELGHLFPGRDPGQLSAEVGARFREPGLPPVAALPGAVELASKIHRLGDPLALVTSASRDHAVPTLDRLGLLGLFTVIVAGDDVIVGKPDPEGYRRASDELGVAPVVLRRVRGFARRAGPPRGRRACTASPWRPPTRGPSWARPTAIVFRSDRGPPGP